MRPKKEIGWYMAIPLGDNDHALSESDINFIKSESIKTGIAVRKIIAREMKKYVVEKKKSS